MRRFNSASCTATNRQGCLLAPLGAVPAVAISVSMTSCGTATVTEGTNAPSGSKLVEEGGREVEGASIVLVDVDLAHGAVPRSADPLISGGPDWLARSIFSSVDRSIGIVVGPEADSVTLRCGRVEFV